MRIIEMFRGQGIELYEQDGTVHYRTDRLLDAGVLLQLRIHRHRIKLELCRWREKQEALLAAAPMWQSENGQSFHDRFALQMEPVQGNRNIIACAFGGTHAVTVTRQFFVAFLSQHSEQTVIFDDAVHEMEKIRSCVGDEFDIDAMLEQNRIRSTLDLHNLLQLGMTGGSNDPDITLAARCAYYEIDSRGIDNHPLGQVTATFHLHEELRRRYAGLFNRINCENPFGYMNKERLQWAWSVFGPASHNLQVMARVVYSALSRNGLHVNLQKAKTTRESLRAELATADTNRAEKIKYRLSHFLDKMTKTRLFPTRFAPLRTGRMSLTGDVNFQGIPHTGGVRECIVPSAGHVFLMVDFKMLELAVIAHAVQVQFGLRSCMAEAINAGRDLHQHVASLIFNKPDVTSHERKQAKSLNFGIPGGLGHKSLCEWAQKHYGIEWTEQEALALREQWLDLFPEMRCFLRSVPADRNGVLTITGRLRANTEFTQNRNTIFQGLAADGMAMVLWKLYREGHRIVSAIHDEVILEIPVESDLDQTIGEIENLMIAGMKDAAPDMNFSVESFVSMTLAKKDCRASLCDTPSRANALAGCQPRKLQRKGLPFTTAYLNEICPEDV